MPQHARHFQSARDADDISLVFGQNLRELSKSYRSVSALCRDLGVNRTQFNRYLSGESLPRPEVLQQICAFFDVDARILLQPLDELRRTAGLPPHLGDFFDAPGLAPRESDLPRGFYRFTCASREAPDLSTVTLRYISFGLEGVSIRHTDPDTQQDWRGMVLRHEGGIVIVSGPRTLRSLEVIFLRPGPGRSRRSWRGYVTRSGDDGAPVLAEYLGSGSAPGLAEARRRGAQDA
jgi:transcriptional regulator with XRE-family HTH domain